jgi:hypothetical protein
MADPPTGPWTALATNASAIGGRQRPTGAIFGERKGENGELNAFAKEICESLVP